MATRKRQGPQPLDTADIWKGRVRFGLSWVEIQIDFSSTVNRYRLQLDRWMNEKPEQTDKDIVQRYQAIDNGVLLFRELLPKEAEKALTFALKQALNKTAKKAIVEGERRGVFVRNPPAAKGRPRKNNKKSENP